MTDLRDDLDRALRAVPVPEAPVEHVRRAGRRLRTRRRLGAAAAALAVAAVAAAFPALTGNGAARTPAPAAGTATPSPGPAGGHDMTVTAGPPGGTTEAPGGLSDKTGQVAQGAVGSMKWRVTVSPPGPKNPGPADSCYTVSILEGGDIEGNCNDLPAALGSGLGAGKPAAFTEWTDGAATELTTGEVAPDVAFFIVTFTDGQQLKLIPVTAFGHRYIAWMAPLSMTIQDVVAHLGGPYSDSGQIAVAVPFDLPGQVPVFGLWQRDGQAAAPVDTRVIGAGTAGGRAWKVIAYEGPWGTCFVSSPGGRYCVLSPQLAATAVIGGRGGSPPGPAFGSAAPGVAAVRVTLSNGTTVQPRLTGVGNEILFAFWAGGVSPVRWTADNAAGRQVGSGLVRQAPAS